MHQRSFENVTASIVWCDKVFWVFKEFLTDQTKISALPTQWLCYTWIILQRTWRYITWEIKQARGGSRSLTSSWRHGLLQFEVSAIAWCSRPKLQYWSNISIRPGRQIQWASCLCHRGRQQSTQGLIAVSTCTLTMFQPRRKRGGV